MKYFITPSGISCFNFVSLYWVNIYSGMEKLHKELFDTYFRKRSKEGNYLIGATRHPYTEYELKTFTSMGLLNDENISMIQKIVIDPSIIESQGLGGFISQYSEWDMTEMIISYPSMCQFFPLNKINGPNISRILIHHPKLYVYFNLGLVKGLALARLLSRHPKMVNMVDVSGLQTNEIYTLLARQPELYDNLDVDKLDRHEVVNLLQDVPILAYKFDLGRVLNSKYFEYFIDFYKTKNPVLSEYYNKVYDTLRSRNQNGLRGL